MPRRLTIDAGAAAASAPSALRRCPTGAPSALRRCLTGAALAAAAAATNALGGETARFVEVAAEAGVDFAHNSGRREQLWTLEITGAGGGVLDFDGDGLLDLWLVQSGPLPQASAGLRPTVSKPATGDRLYRNVGTPSTLRFVDVTDASGVIATGYGMGIATGDIDNDGDADVFVANFGPNQLFENLGDGRFRDITAAAGVAGEAWSISASFADVDDDGLVDLYVGNYLDFPLASYQPCRRWSSRPTYCAPSNFEPQPDRLYRNLGGGRFADISAAAGIDGPRGGAMGVVADDFNGDGRIDFYVANDGVDNLLWLGLGGGRFEEAALLRGVGVNGDGVAEASMGVAAADYDRDGDPDLVVTHDVKESNTLYVNDGAGWFEDRSGLAGVAAPSLPYTGFGLGWVDVDNDGDLDIFSVDGAVAVMEDQIALGIDPPLRQFNQLMLDDGRGRFTEVDGGPAFAVGGVGRGAAFGDLDNDGDMDALVTNNEGPARIYRNDTTSGNWLGLDVRGASGAVVWLESSGERRRQRTDGSYASAHDPRVVFGLGVQHREQFVRVRWPNGAERRFGPLPVNRYHTLRPAP